MLADEVEFVVGVDTHRDQHALVVVDAATQRTQRQLLHMPQQLPHAPQFLLQPPRPPHWGGYRLKPDIWQFWQGRKSRLHDRLRYQQQADGWLRERLAP